MVATLSCARFGYEGLSEEAVAFEPVPGVTHGGPLGGTGGSGGADAGGTANDAVVAGGGTASAGGSGSRVDAGDSGGSGGVDAGDPNDGGVGGVSLGACAPAVSTATWAFVSDTQGWQAEADTGADASMNWTAATGHPAPGALQVDATVNLEGNARIFLEHNAGDLSGRVIYARVFLEAGSSVSAKVFVQTGPGRAWADGDDVYLVAQQWHCVSIDLQNPDVSTPGFDATDVRSMGVFFFGNASSRLYIDHVSY